MFVHIWCEYDFGGSLGGNNNEEILSIFDDETEQDIEEIVKDYIKRNSGLEEEELDGVYGWSDFSPVEV